MGFISGIKMAIFEKASWGVYKLHLIMLIKLSWPNILTSLISLILPVSSTLAVGHIGGDSTALIGAAALGNMFANATGNAVGTGLSMALDTLCSQAFGAKRYKLVGLHCQRAMVILSIACIPIAILWYKAWFILQFIGTKEVADLSQFWIHRLLPSLWPRVMYETYRRYMLSQRIMWPLTVSVGFTVPFHIMNTYLFVYKFNWGFSGAAWATSISYWILFSTLVSVSYLRLVFLRRRALSVSSKHVMLNTTEEEEDNTESGEMEDDTASLGSSVGSNMGLMETEEGEKKWKSTEEEEDNGDPLHTWPALSTDIFRGWVSFLKLGVATALSLVIEWGSFEVNAAIASRLGEVPLAAHAIMCNSASVWYSFPLGVASASTALVGNMLGAGEPDRAKIVARIGLTIALIYGIANGALGLVYKDVLGKLFTEDKEVVQAISKVMIVMWLYGLVDAMKAVGMAILRGSGRPKLTVYGNILSCLIVGYPVAILMVKFDYGLRGLWFGMSTAWMCAATIYAIIIAKTNWQQEVLNAAKRNAEALNSTQKGKELSQNGLLLSVVVKGQKDKVGLILNKNINNEDDNNNNDFAIGDDDGEKRIFLRESDTSVE